MKPTILCLAVTDDAQCATIQQRVFDLFPPWPQVVTLDTLIAELACFKRMSVIEAVRRLRQGGFIELQPGCVRSVYRLRKSARRPIDMRGQHGKSGRPRAHQ